MLVAKAQVVQRHGIVSADRLSIPVDGGFGVLFYSLAVEVAITQIALGFRVSLVRRQPVPSGGSVYVSESEGANFWLGVLTHLQQRGVADILIACIANLKGFAEAIATIYPATEVQTCVVRF